ncbi:MAG: type 4a pilus biogenesis protein PilO [Xanthomonadales bacterium]|nr:type 4a pilus biogenesis protein PilO [Xanthomonadales bacterium]
MSLFDDLRKADINNLGSSPVTVQAVFAGILFLLICGLGWYLYFNPRHEEFDGLVAKERTLRQDFEHKQERAANLQAYREQLQQIELVLQQMLRQLPGKTEMPDLLVDISQTALASGIANELFEPQPEISKDFYAEKPISLRMVGSYHQFGEFVSGVASLPRVVILTMHDISLKQNTRDANAPAGQLILEGTVKTYRYLDDDEQSTSQSASGRR